MRYILRGAKKRKYPLTFATIKPLQQTAHAAIILFEYYPDTLKIKFLL